MALLLWHIMKCVFSCPSPPPPPSSFPQPPVVPTPNSNCPPLPALLLPPAPRGFNPVQDLTDNYQFLYPFGWQEVAVTGADVVYKDVVEPLESISVTMTPTDRKDIEEFGDIQEVKRV